MYNYLRNTKEQQHNCLNAIISTVDNLFIISRQHNCNYCFKSLVNALHNFNLL